MCGSFCHYTLSNIQKVLQFRHFINNQRESDSKITFSFKAYEGGQDMLKKNIIGTNFIMANRDLISKFGVNSAVMLGELYGRMNYFRKRNELKFGYFFATKESIEERTRLSPYKQRKATSILQAVGILDVKHIDIPPKTYYKINEEMLLKVLKNSVVHEMNN